MLFFVAYFFITFFLGFEAFSMSNSASTAPSAAPEISVLDDNAARKREAELKTIVQSSTATKREKAAARKEFLKLRRPGGRGRRVNV